MQYIRSIRKYIYTYEWLDKVISRLPDVVKSADDFLVTGKDMAERDVHLRSLLKRLSDH